MVGTGRQSALPLVLLGCCWCSVAAAVRFKGFDSQSFEFPGVPESVYNILSEQNHQVRVCAGSYERVQEDIAHSSWYDEEACNHAVQCFRGGNAMAAAAMHRI